MSDHETMLRELAKWADTGAEIVISDSERTACLAGADALRREREAAERKAQFEQLQQRISQHLEVCIYCEQAVSEDCAVGRAILRDAKDYYKKAAPTEPTR